MSEAAVQHYLAEYDRSRTALPHGGLFARRTAALERLQSCGFPTRRREEWKYTDVSPITRRNFTLGPAEPAAADEKQVGALRFPQLDCHELVFVNGNFSAPLSRSAPLPDGVTVRSLQEAATAEPALLERFAGSSQEAEEEETTHAFAALNTAFLRDGALIDVPAGTEVPAPIHIIHLTTAAAQLLMSHPRCLVALGRGARAVVIETYAGAPDVEYFTNNQTRIESAAASRLDYYKVQQEGRSAFHIDRTRIRQQADSTVDCHVLSLGGSLARCDVDVELDAPGAAVNLRGLYLTDGRQHVDNHTLVEHKQPHTASREHFRGIMNGRSRAVFNGKVIVHEQAQKTQAHQANANLLLSGDAEVNAKPELEIYADDVKCSHGATVGRLDEDMLFYLRSRALDRATAENLLTYAFADEVIRDIRLAAVRSRLERGIVGELPAAELVREFMQ